MVMDPRFNDVALSTFADDRYVYVTRTSSTSSMQSITAIDPVTLQQHPNATCAEFRSDVEVVFDQTNLYGVQRGSGSNIDIVIAPRAP